MIIEKGCPAAAKLKGTPEIILKTCPECGREIEIFSTDPHGQCECGFIAYNDTQNCIMWCDYARKCVGDEIYEKFAQANADKTVKD